MRAGNSSPSTAALIALALAFAVSMPLVLGFLKDLHPAFDSLAHFRAHLAVLLALLPLPLLFGPMRMTGLAALALAAAAFMTVLGASPLDLIRTKDAGANAAPLPGARYRLLHLNLRFDNPAPEMALSVIGRSQADVVTLNEVSPMWREKLALLSAAYPHRIVCDARGYVGGVAILSKRPFAGGEAVRCLDRGRLAVASIDFGGQAIDVAALHLGWPWPFEQPRQIARLKDSLGSLGETALLAGDFNAAPWSATAVRVADAAGMRLVEGVRPTWLHRRLPDMLRRVAGLPIDHVLTKGGVIVRSIHTGENAGSDHLPVHVEFSLAPAPKREVLEAYLERFLARS